METSPGSTIARGPLILGEDAHRAGWHGEPLDVTPTQFDLLAYMARHAGQVLTPQQLVAAVQGYDCRTQEARELIEPHIANPRSTLPVSLS